MPPGSTACPTSAAPTVGVTVLLRRPARADPRRVSRTSRCDGDHRDPLTNPHAGVMLPAKDAKRFARLGWEASDIPADTSRGAAAVRFQKSWRAPAVVALAVAA